MPLQPRARGLAGNETKFSTEFHMQNRVPPLPISEGAERQKIGRPTPAGKREAHTQGPTMENVLWFNANDFLCCPS
ncbi:hypothetical protein XENTR_v10016171 [Xenopus tropicalis]|nr:hypothetical protein XENTR_v10016171 [Xenopus tropicalis]